MYADSASSAGMAIKNELYSSLWIGCDKLRDGMDASQCWQRWMLREHMCTLLINKIQPR